jgi:hypothetical protein
MDDIAPPSIPEEGAERLCECCGRRPYTVGVSKRYEPGMTEGGLQRDLMLRRMPYRVFREPRHASRLAVMKLGIGQ